MLKSMIGSIVGTQMAKNNPVLGGTAGAVLGTAIPAIISRVSLPVMAAVGVGGYFAKRYFDKQKAEDAEGTNKSANRSDTQPAATRPPGGVSPMLNDTDATPATPETV